MKTASGFKGYLKSYTQTRKKMQMDFFLIPWWLGKLGSDCSVPKPTSHLGPCFQSPSTFPEALALPLRTPTRDPKQLSCLCSSATPSPPLPEWPLTRTLCYSLWNYCFWYTNFLKYVHRLFTFIVSDFQWLSMLPRNPPCPPRLFNIFLYSTPT